MISALPLVLALAATAAPPPAAAQTNPAQPSRVYVGAFLRDVSAFDLKAGEFKVDATLWVKWRGSDVVPAISLANGTVENREELARESDGDWRMVRWRMQGTFRGTFPLHRFPFDEQQLRLEFTLDDPDRILVPDLAASGMSERFSITGWLYDPYFSAQTMEATLASDLGSVNREGAGHLEKTVALALTLRRPFASYVLKFVLPLLIIIAMALLSFFLGASELEVRAGMVVTALLSCVAFHFSQADSLPDVSYLVAADRLFLVGYSVILLALIATVASFRVHAQDEDRSRRLDRLAFRALSLAVVVAMFGILAAARHDPTPEGALAAPSGLPRPPREGPVLRIGVTAVGANTAMTGLQCRGLSSYDAEGRRVPLAITEYPDMTNSMVRLLPDGGMKVRWRLRPGFRFSDGAPITARDLLFSMGLSPEPDRTLTRVDDLTVDATWRRRTPAALVERTLYPAQELEAVARDGGRDAVVGRVAREPSACDGPFVVERLERGESARLVPNRWFAGEQPRLGAIEFRRYATGTELGEALRDGEIHFAPAISVSGLEKLRGDPRFVTRVEVAPALWLLHPDLEVPALANPRVRRALLQAIDRRRFAQQLFEEPGLVTDTWVPPGEPDHLAMPPVPFEPALAAATLATEGAAGLELPVYYQKLSDDSPQMRATLVLLEGLRAAGVKVAPKPMEKGLLELINTGKHRGLVFHVRRGDGVPARFFNVPLPGGKLDRSFRAPHFTEEIAQLLHQYDESLFPERKESLSARLQQAFAQSLPVLPLCLTRDQSAHVRELKGYSPVRRSHYWNVESWTLEPPPASP